MKIELSRDGILFAIEGNKAECMEMLNVAMEDIFKDKGVLSSKADKFNKIKRAAILHHFGLTSRSKLMDVVEGVMFPSDSVWVGGEEH